MIKKIMLTRDERRAIDWIGERYAHGYDLKKVLWGNYDGNFDWENSVDITFEVPENKAWAIAEIIRIETEDWKCSLACFNAELNEKIYNFLN